jgi:hypothetical protein
MGLVSARILPNLQKYKYYLQYVQPVPGGLQPTENISLDENVKKY